MKDLLDFDFIYAAFYFIDLLTLTQPSGNEGGGCPQVTFSELSFFSRSFRCVWGAFTAFEKVNSGFGLSQRSFRMSCRLCMRSFIWIWIIGGS